MIIEEAVEKFNQLPLELQLELGSDEFLHPLKSLEAAYNISLSAIAIYITIGDIQFKDLPKVLEYEFSLSSTVASSLAKDIKEKAFDPILERLNFLDNDPDKAMTLEQQKNFAEKIISSGLISEIHHDPFIVDAINQRLFFILARDEDFHTRLERALYENEEEVTSKSLSINGENVRGTVSNWLKDYISQYGSQTYDSMSQSAFLINSNNAKNLTPGERELLAKVLKTYINIKFFPDSMPSDDGEGWEIIPVDEEVTEEVMPDEIINTRQEISKVAERQTSFSESSKPVAAKPAGETVQKRQEQMIVKPPRVVSTPKTIISTPTPVKKPIAPLTKPTPRPSPQQSQPPKQVVSRPPVETISNESDELLNLKNMLLQYPPHSLEREAIEEEIKKLEKV
jgi:hypothetical protein